MNELPSELTEEEKQIFEESSKPQELQEKTLEGEIIEGNAQGKTKYDGTYPQLLIDLACAGKTNAHFRVKIGIGPTTFESWKQRYPRFKDAVERAKDARKAYYQDMLTDCAFNPKKAYNTVLVSKLFDFHNKPPSEKKQSKGPTINVNIDNTGASKSIANLTPQERKEKLEILKQKLIGDECQDYSQELQELPTLL